MGVVVSGCGKCSNYSGCGQQDWDWLVGVVNKTMGLVSGCGQQDWEWLVCGQQDYGTG